MRTGIGLDTTTGNIYISYSDIESVREYTGKDTFFLVTLKSGEQIQFHNKEAFTRLKNYITQRHPVLDNINPPAEGYGEER